jgi:hypothetical protein
LAETLEDPDDDRHEIDGEPSANFRIRCPARLRALWRDVAELAARSTGGPLSTWQVLELVVAEAASGVEVEPGVETVGASNGAKEDALSIDAVHLNRAETRAGEIDSAFSVPRTKNRALAAAAGLSAAEMAGLRRLLAASDARGNGKRSSDESDEMPSSAAAYLLENDDVFDCGAPEEIDRHLQDTIRSLQNIDWQFGRLLDTFIRLRLHHHLGYSRVCDYVEARLPISPSKVRALVRIAAGRRPAGEALAAAYRSGELSWVRALLLQSVLSEEFAQQWVRRASRVTVRRLQDEVRWAADIRDRTHAWLPIPPPTDGAKLEFSDAEAKRQMRARFDEATADRLTTPTTDTDAYLYFVGPASVIALARDVIFSSTRPYEAPWRAFERILIHARDTWANVGRHRNPIHERDGWRCRVPACSSRRNLQEHHVTYRSRGGGNERSNRVSICAWHHLRGIHGGVVRARGDAEEIVTWELGVGLRTIPGAGGDRRPLIRFENEAYVPEVA